MSSLAERREPDWLKAIVENPEHTALLREEFAESGIPADVVWVRGLPSCYVVSIPGDGDHTISVAVRDDEHLTINIKRGIEALLRT